MQSVQEISIRSSSIEVSALGITFPASISWEEWEELGEKLGTASKSLGFMLGDWINSDATGADIDDRYAAAMKLTGYDRRTLQMYSRVTRCVPLEVRVGELSFDHHRKVVSLPIEEQRRWLAAAVKHGMSTRRLQKSIVAGRVVGVDELCKGKIHKIETVHPFVNRTVSLFGKLKRTGWLRKQSPEQIRCLRRDLEPVRKICDELDSCLEQKESI
jgi:hypothetical protein